MQDNEALLQELIAEITLNQSLLQSHIETEYAGNLAAFGRSVISDNPPHRATVLRWVSETGLPKSARRLLELAITLDVDPFLLLQIPETTFKSLCAYSSWITQWGKYHKSLTFLSDLIGLGQNTWPAPHLAESYEGEWQTWDLEYISAQREPYLHTVYVQPERYYDFAQTQEVVEQGRQYQVWYIAVRDARSQGDALLPQGLWRPFGIFFVTPQDFHLLNLGTGEWLTTSRQAEAFGVSFYCGPGSAIFRIASLHAFEVYDEAPQGAEPVLRYVFPA